MEAITIVPEQPDSDAVRWCFAQYYAELDRRIEGGFDASIALPLVDAGLLPPLGVVLVARRSSQLLGCGAVKLGEPDVAEIKRLWILPAARGQGVGSRILAELEARAATAGKRVVRLDTNGALTEAVALYRRRGYREIAPFNEERFADHWFEKDLAGAGLPIDGDGRAP
jgi:ribosomal protein S18 acetylase RimI-like enzyme